MIANRVYYQLMSTWVLVNNEYLTNQLVEKVMVESLMTWCITCVRTAAPLLCSVFLQVVEELLRLLCQLPLRFPLLLQGRICFLTLVDLHPGERQTQQHCLQGQDVQEDRDIVQNLKRHRQPQSSDTFPMSAGHSYFSWSAENEIRHEKVLEKSGILVKVKMCLPPPP